MKKRKLQKIVAFLLILSLVWTLLPGNLWATETSDNAREEDIVQMEENIEEASIVQEEKVERQDITQEEEVEEQDITQEEKVGEQDIIQEEETQEQDIVLEEASEDEKIETEDFETPETEEKEQDITYEEKVQEQNTVSEKVSESEESGTEDLGISENEGNEIEQDVMEEENVNDIEAIDIVQEGRQDEVENIDSVCASAIKGNGTNGIYIDIYSAPYTTYKNKAYGSYAYGKEGCAWFASARACQITGKDTNILSGYGWWNSGYSTYGYSRGNTLKAKALACYANHVAVVEAVNGNTVTVSQGGMSGLSDASHGYCVISTMTKAKLESQGGCGTFYGYVYLTSNVTPTKPTISPNGVPGTLTVGSKFSIGGTINSNVNISSVTVGVYDAAGNMKTGKTVSPNSTSYNIKNVDAAILFNNLPVGVYRYTIKATNSAGTSEYTKYFAVLSNKETIPDGIYCIATSKNTAYGLNIDNNSNESGANVFLWNLESSNYQKFNFRHIGNGYYEITNVGSGLSLDVKEGRAANYTNIQQYMKNGSTAQMWQVLPYNGSYYIIPKCATSQALDLSEGNVAIKTNIQTYQFNHNVAQCWTLIKTSKNMDTAVITEEYNNHKYEVYDNSMSWVDAKAFCEKKGGNLVAINTEEENTFITNLIKKGSRNWYWLGASDAEVEGQWKWVTNENFAYSKWASGEPNGGTGENFAIIIAKEQYVGQWGDIIGNPRANSFYGVPHGGFICEYNLNRSIEKAEIKLSTEKYTYDGKEKTPEVTVILDNKTLAKNTDYTVSYQNNTSVGTAKVIVTGKGNYAGTAEKTFTIEKAVEVVGPKIFVSNQNAVVGGEVRVPVSITKNPGIAGFSFEIGYDKAILTLKSIEKAELTSVGTFDTNEAIVNWYTDENVGKDGELFTLVFEVAKDAKVDSTKVSVSLREGKKNLVDENSQYVEANYEEGEIQLGDKMLGDVNQDGDITIGDVVLLNRYVLGKVTNFTEEAKKLGDVTGDGDITIGDVVLLNRFVLGKVKTFVVE